MKRYFAVGKGGFKTALAYRFHFYVTILTAPITLIIYYYLWQSIYNYSGAEVIKGFTFAALISYYAINMIVGFCTWTFVDEELEDNVRHGHLIGYLLRPVNFIYWHFMFETGFNLLAILLEVIPLFIIAIVFFKMHIAGIGYFALFFISLFLASILNYLIGYMVGITAFWFKRISGIRRMRRALVSFLAGGLIPLSFFPQNIQTISHYLPFEYIRYVPINIYLGGLSYLESGKLIGLQVVWILVLFFIANLFWKRALKKFAGAGA